MTLIKSISGIRGTIGGLPDQGLTPLDAVIYASAYAQWLKEHNKKSKLRVVIGRDARMSGSIISQLVCSTLMGMGVDVVDLGLSTTPTVEMAVKYHSAAGGIILTASHNPREWNALKLLNQDGEFISAEAGAYILKLAEKKQFSYAEVEALGHYSEDTDSLKKHINDIVALPYVDREAISKKNPVVVIDAINSSGAFAVPQLLEALGVRQVHVINKEMHGNFAHNPEPLPEHLAGLSAEVRTRKADLGISIDPDVDRLAFVNEDGSMFGEEYTLVAVADYILSVKGGGNTVSNLSSTRALRDVTAKRGGSYSASAVGEVNVVTVMKKTKALIGGEGNGGIIVPELHYGRDALVGIAIFLTHYAKAGQKMTTLKASYPPYFISKNKIELTQGLDVDGILQKVAAKYSEYKPNTIDGVKIDFPEGWVHLRKSNTEPIIRIYSESATEKQANAFAAAIMDDIRAYSQG